MNKAISAPIEQPVTESRRGDCTPQSILYFLSSLSAPTKANPLNPPPLKTKCLID